MFKLFVVACILAFAAAEPKPGYIAAPLAYSAPLTYPSNYAYGGNPYAYSNGYAGYAPYYKSYAAPLAYNYGSYYY